MEAADTLHYARCVSGSQHMHLPLSCPTRDLPARAFLCQTGPGPRPFLVWLGWKEGQEEATLRPAPPGLLDRGRSDAGPYLVPFTPA